MAREGLKSGWKVVASLAFSVVLSACGSDSSTDASMSDGVGGTGITSIFTSPSEMGVGDIMPIEFNGETEVAVDFGDVEDGAEFILAVGSYNYSGSGTQMRLAAGAESLDPLLSAKASFADYEDPFQGEEYGVQEVMSAWLRASESVLNATEVAGNAPSASANKALKASALKSMSVGDSDSFRVLGSLTSTQVTHDVSATAKCVGEHVVFFLDDDSVSLISDEDISVLCREFDDTAGEEIAMLGSMYDPDGDGKLHVLMTQRVNALGALGGGIITGYFYAGDYYERSGSNPASNHRDIIYTMVPDPSGSVGVAVSRSFAMSNLLPAVLPHELQHAISYNQHVFVNGGAPEENWLNEGLSHFMEDYFGYNVENPSRYAMFLASPSTYGVVTQSSPNLMERGAAYLFMRYMFEQADDGDSFLQRLYGSRRGVENLEFAFEGPEDMNEFSEFMARWTAALAMTNRGISSDPRFVYKAREIHPETGNWQGVCLDCSAEDNRGTQLTGVNLNSYFGYHTANLDAASMTFYAMSSLPGQLELKGSYSGGNYGLLIRTR